MAYFPRYDGERRTLTEAAARLEDMARDDQTQMNMRRFEDDPPPYQSSEDRTRSPTPTTRRDEEDGLARALKLASSRLKGTPASMWELQTRHERGRLLAQINAGLYGHRDTFTFDENLDRGENADNNIRASWINQGIWKDAWGLPWAPPPGGQSRKRWNRPQNSPHPRPEGDWSVTGPVERFKSANRQATPIDRLQDLDTALAATAITLQTPEALLSENPTRPYTQFLCQVLRERTWMEDEREARLGVGASRHIDFTRMAYERMKDIWCENGLWRSEWNLFPGRHWAHEEIDESTIQDPDFIAYYQCDAMLPSQFSCAERHITSSIGEDTIPNTLPYCGSKGYHSGEQRTSTRSARLQFGMDKKAAQCFSTDKQAFDSAFGSSITKVPQSERTKGRKRMREDDDGIELQQPDANHPAESPQRQSKRHRAKLNSTVEHERPGVASGEVGTKDHSVRLSTRTKHNQVPAAAGCGLRRSLRLLEQRKQEEAELRAARWRTSSLRSTQRRETANSRQARK